MICSSYIVRLCPVIIHTTITVCIYIFYIYINNFNILCVLTVLYVRGCVVWVIDYPFGLVVCLMQCYLFYLCFFLPCRLHLWWKVICPGGWVQYWFYVIPRIWDCIRWYLCRSLVIRFCWFYICNIFLMCLDMFLFDLFLRFPRLLVYFRNRLIFYGE
jgi:hypothetical protein